MIKIPKRHATEVVAWLDAMVSPNISYRMPESERTDESRLNPYSVSSTAMTAHWRGQDDAWRVMQSARQRYIEIQCKDPRHELYIATKWS